MAIFNSQISINEKPLEMPAQAWIPTAGAVVDFWGVVREDENGQAITGIEYEAHRAMAEHQMELIVERALADYGALKIILHHRIGFVPVAEPSLFLRVMSGHRQAAFSAGQWIVDELKRRVPIWKRPVLIEPTPNMTATIARPDKLQTAEPSP